MNEFLTELAALMQKHRVFFEIEPDFYCDEFGSIVPISIMYISKSGVKFEKADFREIARGETIKVINHETINKAIR